MAKYSRFKFTKLWTNPTDFPSYEADEKQVRADMQCLFDELAAALNSLMTALEKSFDEANADTIPFTATESIPMDTVQKAIELLSQQLINVTVGALPEGSVSTAIIAESAITAAKLATASVTTEKVASAAITVEKLAEDVKGYFATLDSNKKVAAAQASAYIGSASASKTLGLSDAGSVIRCTNSAAITVTIPTNASVAFPVGTEIELYRAGAGAVTVAGASGVTIECAGSGRSISDRYTRVHLKKWAENTWSIEGNVG